MRRFWKMCGLTALLVGVVLLVAEEGIGQQFPSRPGGGGPPGGGFGGGGFGMDPDAMWNAMSKGQDRINLNDPANAWMKGMRERRGQPIPPDGIITRDMFKTEFQQRMAQGGSGFGSGGFGSKGGRDGGFGGKGGRDGGFGGKGGFGQPPGAPGGTIVIQGGPGGFTQVPAPGGAPGGDSGDFVDGIFKRSDRNGDGRITMDEASDRLRPSFAQYDRNGDGALDLNEFRAYMGDRMSQGGRGGPGGVNGPPGSNPFQPGSFPPPGNFPSAPPSFDPNQGRERGDRKRGGEEEEDARPVVHRYGKLPKELPSWFEKYDTDRDGMVGLYEWRRASEKTDKFVEMDLNGDGYLTADEWLKFSRLQLEKKPGEDDEEGGGPTITRFGPGGSGGSSGSGRPDFTRGGGDRTSKGGPPSFGKGEKGGREKGSKSGEKGNGKRNPFTGG